MVDFKCKKCRVKVLNFPESSILSAHGQEMKLRDSSNPTQIQFVDKSASETVVKCLSLDQDVFYIHETHLPEWITNCVDKGNWTRGKLLCPGCSARLGSFDFVSGFHCACHTSVVPSIHLVKSKIDPVSTSSIFHTSVS